MSSCKNCNLIMAKNGVFSTTKNRPRKVYAWLNWSTLKALTRRALNDTEPIIIYSTGSRRRVPSRFNGYQVRSPCSMLRTFELVKNSNVLQLLKQMVCFLEKIMDPEKGDALFCTHESSTKNRPNVARFTLNDLKNWS